MCVDLMFCNFKTY